MKKLLFVPLALLMLAGCRRADIREITVEIPGLSAVAEKSNEEETAQKKILDALLTYEGVKTNKIEWSRSGNVPTLTLQFDSMQIAETNIRKAIEETGYAVSYPALEKGQPAGYINTRGKEIKY